MSDAWKDSQEHWNKAAESFRERAERAEAQLAEAVKLLRDTTDVAGFLQDVLLEGLNGEAPGSVIEVSKWNALSARDQIERARAFLVSVESTEEPR